MAFLNLSKTEKQIPSKVESLNELEVLLSKEELFCLVQELKTNKMSKPMIWNFIKKHLQ